MVRISVARGHLGAHHHEKLVERYWKVCLVRICFFLQLVRELKSLAWPVLGGEVNWN